MKCNNKKCKKYNQKYLDNCGIIGKDTKQCEKAVLIESQVAPCASLIPQLIKINRCLKDNITKLKYENESLKKELSYYTNRIKNNNLINLTGAI